MTAVHSYEVSVKGTNWYDIVNARTPGAAKVQYWRQVVDAWPSVPFTAMRVRRIGAPITSRMFEHVAKMRGVSFRCGDPVTVGRDIRGVLVGTSSGACFEILCDEDSPKYANSTVTVHPSEIQLIAREKEAEG